MMPRRPIEIARRTVFTGRRALLGAVALAILAGAGGGPITGGTGSGPPAGDAHPARPTAVVRRIGAMLETHYTDAEVAAACAKHLRTRLAAGDFDDAADPTELARRLTASLQSVSRDQHMHVSVRSPDETRVDDPDPARRQREELERLRRENFGFERVERLDGNVGYLDMRYFSSHPRARETAAAAMAFLANTDAVIFDMRKNGGGNPEMIRFLCSYLFDEPTHLTTIRWRDEDRTRAYWTLADLPRPALADRPVFVLTSADTFSGAEGFCYILQARRRAAIVGETTRGGANPGRVFPIDERLSMFISTGRVIDPVTGTNWEGVGVRPDVPVDAGAALETALEMARKAVEARRQEDAGGMTSGG